MSKKHPLFQLEKQFKNKFLSKRQMMQNKIWVYPKPVNEVLLRNVAKLPLKKKTANFIR